MYKKRRKSLIFSAKGADGGSDLSGNVRAIFFLWRLEILFRNKNSSYFKIPGSNDPKISIGNIQTSWSSYFAMNIYLAKYNFNLKEMWLLKQYVFYVQIQIPRCPNQFILVFHWICCDKATLFDQWKGLCPGSAAWNLTRNIQFLNRPRLLFVKIL